MEGSFSDSALSRLPAVIQRLDLRHQNVFIHLRLGKKEEDISRLLSMPPEEARQAIDSVKQALAGAGLLDMVEAPRFVSIHSPGPESDHEFQLHSFDLPIEKKLILNEFISILKEAVDGLPPRHSKILRLRYNQQMSAREILGFVKKVGIDLIPGKGPEEINEQDIFYALNKALKEVLNRLHKSYGEGLSLCPEGLKEILEEIEV